MRTGARGVRPRLLLILSPQSSGQPTSDQFLEIQKWFPSTSKVQDMVRRGKISPFWKKIRKYLANPGKEQINLILLTISL